MIKAAKTLKRVPDLRDQIFEQLRESIHAGELDVSERLTEVEVAKRYNVSRTPAREALALLHKADLLKLDDQGYGLPVFSEKDINDMFEVRRMIEPPAIRLICADATAPELKTLERFSKAELKDEDDAATYGDVNRRMRQLLFSYLRNDKLRATINSFEDRLAFVRIRTLQLPELRKKSVNGNSRLLSAITKRNADEAAKWMNYLLDESQKAMIALV